MPKEVKELYTSSPENRLSITVIETINAAGSYIPPFIILPGQKLMDNWAHPNLEDNAWVTTSPTGYISNEAMLEYLDHFIEFSDSGPGKEWSMILLDGHKCHYSDDFLMKAETNNIHLQIFPSHETHALQPLDVGIFRQWKHQQNKFINKALRQYDFKYSLTSFFRDVSEFRKIAMKEHTIKNSFSKPGIWPINCKRAILARSRYNGKTRRNNEEVRRQAARKRKQEEVELDEPELPIETQHIHQRPRTHYEAAMYMKEICTRGTLEPPSSPTAYREALMETHELLIQADMQADQIQNLEAAMSAERSRQITTRKSVHRGGGINVGQWKAKIDERNRREIDVEIRKIRKNIQISQNKAKKALERIGIDARRAKREYVRGLGNLSPDPSMLSSFRSQIRMKAAGHQRRYLAYYHPQISSRL